MLLLDSETIRTAAPGATFTPTGRKDHGVRYRLLEFLLDLTGLAIAWHVTLRVATLLALPDFTQLAQSGDGHLIPPLSAVLALWGVAALWLENFHRSTRTPVHGSALRVIESAVTAGASVIVLSFFSRELGVPASRTFVLLFTPLCFVILLMGRMVEPILHKRVEALWPSPERIAVLGYGETAREVINRVRRPRCAFLTVAGVILPDGASAEGLGNPVPVLGTVSQLGEIVNRMKLDRILILDHQLEPAAIERCYLVARRMGVTVNQILDNPCDDVEVGVTSISGLALVEVKPVYFTRRQELIKRGFDIVVAGINLLLFVPILALFAVLTKLTSRGPVFYKSPRVGRGGRHFNFLKFRSMYTGLENRGHLAARNEQSGHLFKMKNDPRVTPLGRVMRRFSIDEFPQLINVLRGDMSLIGPRPLPAADLDPDGQSRKFAVWAEQRSRVLPGITGLWQVSGRSDVPFEKMMELDIHYIQNWSLELDLRILLKTPWAVLTGHGAY
jgi:exopolysaccharide biosynthesis polyprenyl glycosylphosphotransferase